MNGKTVVFDSGFGGLTVLRELLRVLPDEEYVYFGDSAHAPYGEKSPGELLELTSDICRLMTESFNVKCFIVGCNTTSSEVWTELTDRFSDYAFIGIEPAVKRAAEENPGARILVLATTATVNGRRLEKRVREYKDRADITLLAPSMIVPAVESFSTGTQEFKSCLRDVLSDHIGAVDCVVLGCTHFPFVKRELEEILGENVRFYDAAADVADLALRVYRGVPLEEIEDTALPVSLKRAKNAVISGTTLRLGSASGMAGSPREKPPDSCSPGLSDGSPDAFMSGSRDRAPDGPGKKIIFLNSDPLKIKKEEELLSFYEHSYT